MTVDAHIDPADHWNCAGCGGPIDVVLGNTDVPLDADDLVHYGCEHLLMPAGEMS